METISAKKKYTLHGQKQFYMVSLQSIQAITESAYFTDASLYNYWLMMRATYDMLDLKTKCCPRPKATFCLLVQHIICCPNIQLKIVLIYLHWFRIKYSIQTITKQTDHDQTGLNLDELIWDEKLYCELKLLHHHTCPRHPGCEQQIDTTWDEFVSDKVDSERIDLLVTSNAS